jgi:hypothetical protein
LRLGYLKSLKNFILYRPLSRMQTTSLPSGCYLISACTESNFYAGRRLSSAWKKASASPARPFFYPNFFEDDDDDAPQSKQRIDLAKDIFYYTSESAADFAFLDALDEGSPWAAAARTRIRLPTPVTESDSESLLDLDTPLSPIISEAGSFPLRDLSMSDLSAPASEEENSFSIYSISDPKGGVKGSKVKKSRVLTMVLDNGEQPPQVCRVLSRSPVYTN